MSTYFYCIMNIISIHAAQEGCDRRCLVLVRLTVKFQSTQPKRAATLFDNSLSLLQSISIHAARVGCDLKPIVSANWRTGISIHASRVGCDFEADNISYAHIDFNPRSPSGLRQSISSRAFRSILYFNPRSPSGLRRGRF